MLSRKAKVASLIILLNIVLLTGDHIEVSESSEKSDEYTDENVDKPKSTPKPRKNPKPKSRWECIIVFKWKHTIDNTAYLTSIQYFPFYITSCEKYCGIAAKCVENTGSEEDDSDDIGCKITGRRRKKRNIQGLIQWLL